MGSWDVLKRYPVFRWFIITSISKDMGDWLVKVANLLVVQQWAGTGTALSHLVLSSLIPKAILAPLGGWLSDNYDRRRLMILLDAMSGTVVLGFLVAIYYKSTTILFIVTAIRSGKASTHYPISNGILPQIITNSQDLQYASTILNGIFGLMSMVGGLVAGSAAVVLGVQACYIIDSLTYFLSCIVMSYMVSGNYKSVAKEENRSNEMEGKGSRSKKRGSCGGCGETIKYLFTSGCAMLVFLKPTDSLIWGPGDILGIEISTVRNADGTEDETASSMRIGYYYCFIGLGVLLGPVFANLIADASRPVSLQQSCCAAMFIAATGWILAAYSTTFNLYLLASWISGLGYGILWAYSSLLLQLLVDDSMLGRVLSIEYFLFVAAESCSSGATGPLFDAGLSTENLCLLAACLALTVFLFWTSFHLCGGGAAHPRFNHIILESMKPDAGMNNNRRAFRGVSKTLSDSALIGYQQLLGKMSITRRKTQVVDYQRLPLNNPKNASEEQATILPIRQADE